MEPLEQRALLNASYCSGFDGGELFDPTETFSSTLEPSLLVASAVVSTDKSDYETGELVYLEATLDDASPTFQCRPTSRSISIGPWIQQHSTTARSWSLAIDSAYAVGAPLTDREGLTRLDDPATPNTGGGTPDYIDMGSDEFQGQSNDVTPPVVLTPLNSVE